MGNGLNESRENFIGTRVNSERLVFIFSLLFGEIG